MPEKKTADETAARVEDKRERVAAPFLSIGGMAQGRYERLRTYMLTEPAARPRVSPAQFDLRRFERFGVLGLVEHDVLCPEGGLCLAKIQSGSFDGRFSRSRAVC